MAPLDRHGNEIRERFLALVEERILILDGAMGTAIQNLQLDEAAFGGEALNGCNENLVATRPDAIRGIHRAYLEAGADLIETNTFGGTPVVLAEYDLADRAEELNLLAARLAREEVDRASGGGARDKTRFVVGSMGPTTKTLTVTGGITFEALAESYRVQARGLLSGGCDILILETVQDTLNLKAGYCGILAAFEDTGIARPLALSCTIEPMGTMLAGQGVEAFYASVEHIEPLFIGMNCATGPRFMTDHLRTLAGLARCPISCFPNAGLPNDEGQYDETPKSLSDEIEKFIAEGWVNIIGGCCGTTAAHVAALCRLARGRTPRRVRGARRAVVAGIDPLVLDKERAPIIVGERTNVIGSRRFKKLIAEGEFEKGAEVGRAQVRGGAHIVDVCMADPDRNELEDMTRMLGLITRMVKVPLMIDSTDHRVIEAALRLSQGKSIINSINLEDGEERFEHVVPLARKYGAAMVVGCIDEDPVQGMAVTVERKLEVARRSHELLTRKYGVPEEDIIFDALVFPVGTGDKNYTEAGIGTVEGVRAITEAFPRCRTILGISNVSFGLPAAGREALNSVFLYHCVKAGLSLAIVNSEKLERYAAIPQEERKVCEDLLFCRVPDPITVFNDCFGKRQAKKKEASSLLSLPLEQRLARNIIDGTKEWLEEALELALKKYATPLEVINGPLMAGMAEVGRLFNNNELIVAEVLQSAEAMKAAVAYLEPRMEKSASNARGKILLATVKGDVHDIGKNLVQIILANNGYEVVDLGIKVPPADLIEAAREHRPDAIGLSGLLVKSAQQMVVTVQDLDQAGVKCPVLVGGAALSARFAATQIAGATEATVVYARDAMHGLDIANRLMSPQSTEAFVREVRQEQERLARGGSARSSQHVAALDAPARAPEIEILADVPAPPD
ncbi:MAG: homocysteine S-methyltransferase family protein, partial [Planctomycetes bacterium]|nr:homocysteine S-methyltransferase family protein [Planctomycetota bacterium]